MAFATFGASYLLLPLASIASGGGGSGLLFWFTEFGVTLINFIVNVIPYVYASKTGTIPNWALAFRCTAPWPSASCSSACSRRSR